MDFYGVLRTSRVTLHQQLMFANNCLNLHSDIDIDMAQKARAVVELLED